MGEVSLQTVFPTAVVYFSLNISDSGKKSQVKIRGVLIFKIRLAGGGKTGWSYLVLGYIPASIEIKTLAFEHVPSPQKSHWVLYHILGNAYSPSWGLCEFLALFGPSIFFDQTFFSPKHF